MDLAEQTSADCNGNGVPDECDLADAGSADANGNGIPDECEPDCNDNGVPDGWDITTGASADCTGNGVPDECDLASGAASDVNTNGLPDACEPDCNDNGVPDDWDIAAGTSADCDANGRPDECQADTDGDSVIDPCDGCPDDPAKIAAGVCGCGAADADTDADGVPDCIDNCPSTPNPDQADRDENGIGDLCDQAGRVVPDSQFLGGLIDVAAGNEDADPESREYFMDTLGRAVDALEGGPVEESGRPFASLLEDAESGRTIADELTPEEEEALLEATRALGLCPAASTLVLGLTLLGLRRTRRRA